MNFDLRKLYAPNKNERYSKENKIKYIKENSLQPKIIDIQ